MEELILAPTEFEAEVDPAQLGTGTPPTPSYIISKRLAQNWLATETEWKSQDPISILDLAAGEGEFSDIICDHASTAQKRALWVDTDTSAMDQGVTRVDGAFEIETLFGNVEDAKVFDLLNGREFNRIAMGLLHHHIGADRYREILRHTTSHHLATDGLILIVELCGNMYPGITREMVVPKLMASIPDNVRFVAGTPRLVQTPVRNTAVDDLWSIEFFCAALASASGG